jgi:hypothetical protein
VLRFGYAKAKYMANAIFHQTLAVAAPQAVKAAGLKASRQVSAAVMAAGTADVVVIAVMAVAVAAAMITVAVAPVATTIVVAAALTVAVVTVRVDKAAAIAVAARAAGDNKLDVRFEI